MNRQLSILTLCFAALFCTLKSEAQNYWKGGTPGKETDWNTAKNWSQNRIPDWTQDVVIPDISTQSGYFPIIKTPVESIPHLKIYSNATLIILPEGSLLINGATTFNSGIYLAGRIICKGDLNISHFALEEIEREGGYLFLEHKMLVQKN